MIKKLLCISLLLLTCLLNFVLAFQLYIESDIEYKFIVKHSNKTELNVKYKVQNVELTVLTSVLASWLYSLPNSTVFPLGDHSL